MGSNQSQAPIQGLSALNISYPNFLSPQVTNDLNCNLDPYFFLQPSRGFVYGNNNEKFCMYNLDDFKHPSQAKNYINKFNLESDDKIFEKVCFVKTERNCPSDPETMRPMKSCSVLRSNSEYGFMCRKWAKNYKNKNNLNFLKEQWCEMNKNSEDCKCINRKYSTEYNNLKDKFLQHDSSCWYKPCSNDGGYLILDNDQQCNLQLCQVIYDLKHNNSVNFDKVVNNISCQMPSTSTRQPEKSFMKKEEKPTTYNYRFVILFFLMLIFITVLFLY